MEGQLVLGALWSCCQLVPREVFQVHCANINVSIFANLLNPIFNTLSSRCPLLSTSHPYLDHADDAFLLLGLFPQLLMGAAAYDGVLQLKT